jgi:hypothetical protein
MNTLEKKLRHNELINKYYRLQRLRRNNLRKYNNGIAMVDRLNWLNKITGNIQENFDPNDIRSQNIRLNIKNVMASRLGTMTLNNQELKDFREEAKNNIILKESINKNLNILDKEFINIVDDYDNKNKKIMNINRLIQENEYASTKKDKDIFILKSYFSALIFIIVIGLFYMTSIISGSKFLYAIIFIILFTTGFVLLNIYRSNRENKVKELSELSIKTAKKLEKEAVRFIAPLIKIDQCPTNRKCKKEKLTTPIIINPNSVNVRAPEVYRNQPDNPFKDGIKSPISINANNCNPNDKDCINKIIPNNPVPGVDNARVYTCKWNGNPEGMLNSNLGGSVNNMKYFRTYIPCQYYPGYIEATDNEKKEIGDTNLPFDNSDGSTSFPSN